MNDEVMNIDQLDFEEDNDVRMDGSVEEQNFGLDSSYEKPWMEGIYNEDPSKIENPTKEEEKDNIISILLKERGIQNPKQIKFEGDDGNIETRDWDSLSLEEQYNIIKTSEDNSQNDLDDQEIQLINQLRLSGITPEQYYMLAKQEGAEEYAAQQKPAEIPYVVDDFTDEELYLYDLKAKAEDMTDEELLNSLDSAKQNESAFKKQMAGLREEYRKLEQEDKAQQQLFETQQRQQEFQEFQESVYDSISNIQDIGGAIELEDEDKNLIAEFILGRDNAGISYLGKALNDPETLVKMSWFALKGEEALDDIQNYYSEQIKAARQAGYNEGLAASQNTPIVKVQKPKVDKITAFSQKNYGSINDLD